MQDKEIKESLKINAEIRAIFNFLFNSNLNKWSWERVYLYEKLLDLNHCYLLAVKRELPNTKQINKFLKENNYKIECLNNIIPAYYGVNEKLGNYKSFDDLIY